MKVQDILTDESKWCKEHCAYDAQGNIVDPNNENAVCWCLYGALAKAGLWNTDEDKRLTNAIHSRFKMAVSSFNDRSSFAEVRALIEELDI